MGYLRAVFESLQKFQCLQNRLTRSVALKMNLPEQSGKVSAVELKPAIFLFKPGGDILARSDFALGLIHRKARERRGFEVVLFGCSG